MAVGVGGGERPGRAELGLGGGDREAHRDRVAEPSAPVPAFDEPLGVARPRDRIVPQRLGGVPVHHRLPADEGVAPPLGGGEESVRRDGVDGGKDERGGRSMLHEPVEEALGGGAGVPVRGVAALLREGEAVQPVEEVLSGRGEHPVLREVDVGVDEPGEHERVPVVVRREVPEALRKAAGGSAPRDAAVPGDRDRPPPMEPDRAPRSGERRIVAVGQHRAANDSAVRGTASDAPIRGAAADAAVPTRHRD